MILQLTFIRECFQWERGHLGSSLAYCCSEKKTCCMMLHLLLIYLRTCLLSKYDRLSALKKKKVIVYFSYTMFHVLFFIEELWKDTNDLYLTWLCIIQKQENVAKQRIEETHRLTVGLASEGTLLICRYSQTNDYWYTFLNVVIITKSVTRYLLFFLEEQWGSLRFNSLTGSCCYPTLVTIAIIVYYNHYSNDQIPTIDAIIFIITAIVIIYSNLWRNSQDSYFIVVLFLMYFGLIDV